MTPPSKKVQLKTVSPSRISAGMSLVAAGEGVGGGAGKGRGALLAKQLQFSPRPVPVKSSKYLKSQARSKVKKMQDLDAVLESWLPDNYAEDILASLQVLGLTTDKDVLNDLTDVPEDSFFVQLIPYFPQCNKPGRLEKSVAAQICATLCDFVATEGHNYTKVISLCFSFFSNQ